jgi:hypothetical protein
MRRHASIESILAFTNEASHLQVSWLRSPGEAEAAIGSLSSQQALYRCNRARERERYPIRLACTYLEQHGHGTR